MKKFLTFSSLGLIFILSIVALIPEEPAQTNQIHDNTESINEIYVPSYVNGTDSEVTTPEKPEDLVEESPPQKPIETPNCHPSYSGCLNPNASDYDCASGSGNGPYYTGAVKVIGPDVFDLDRDNDGWGCE